MPHCCSQEGATDPVPARWYEAPSGRRRLRRAREEPDAEGRGGRNRRHTIFNDWPARDIQRLEDQLPFGFFKGKEGAHTLGPYLVTADELEPTGPPMASST